MRLNLFLKMDFSLNTKNIGDERILLIAEKGKFLGDGIASNLFWVD